MVDVFIPEQKPDKNTYDNYLNTTTFGTLDVLGATLDETLYYNPLSAANRFFDQYTGEGRTGQKLSPDEWAQSPYFREGIEVGEEGITEGLANLLAERKDKRDSIKFTLNRSQGGLGLGALQFGTALAGSMLDPLNVASAFIPIVGQARMATMAARFGKTGSRLVTGAVDGAVGAAILEPLVIGQAYLEQDVDYGLMDSFLNVTLGGVLGGGLHVGFGKISDRIEASKVKDEALVRAVAQAVSDQEINVANLHRQEKKVDEAEAIQRSNERLAEQSDVVSVERRIDPDTGEIIEEKVNRKPGYVPVYKRKGKARPPILRAEKPKTLAQFIRAKGGIDPTSQGAADLQEIVPKQKSGKFYVSAAKGGRSVDDMLTAAREEGYLPPEIEGQPDELGINELIDAVREDVTGNSQYSAADADAIAAYETAQQKAAEADRRGIDPKGMDDATFERALADAAGDEDYYDFNTATLFGDVADKNLEPIVDGVPLTEQEMYDIQTEAQLQDYNLGIMRDEKPILDEMDEAGMSVEELELNQLREANELLEEDVAVFVGEDLIPQEMLDDIASADDAVRRAETSYDELTRKGAVCMNRNAPK
jgi:hypothetical protein